MPYAEHTLFSNTLGSTMMPPHADASDDFAFRYAGFPMPADCRHLPLLFVAAFDTLMLR